MAARQTTGRQLDITTVIGGGYPQLGQGYPQNICSIAAGGRVVESRLGGGWVRLLIVEGGAFGGRRLCCVGGRVAAEA